MSYVRGTASCDGGTRQRGKPIKLKNNSLGKQGAQLLMSHEDLDLNSAQGHVILKMAYSSRIESIACAICLFKIHES